MTLHNNFPGTSNVPFSQGYQPSHVSGDSPYFDLFVLHAGQNFCGTLNVPFS